MPFGIEELTALAQQQKQLNSLSPEAREKVNHMMKQFQDNLAQSGNPQDALVKLRELMQTADTSNADQPSALPLSPTLVRPYIALASLNYGLYMLTPTLLAPAIYPAIAYGNIYAHKQLTANTPSAAAMIVKHMLSTMSTAADLKPLILLSSSALRYTLGCLGMDIGFFTQICLMVMTNQLFKKLPQRQQQQLRTLLELTNSLLKKSMNRLVAITDKATKTVQECTPQPIQLAASQAAHYSFNLITTVAKWSYSTVSEDIIPAVFSCFSYRGHITQATKLYNEGKLQAAIEKAKKIPHDNHTYYPNALSIIVHAYQSAIAAEQQSATKRKRPINVGYIKGCESAIARELYRAGTSQHAAIRKEAQSLFNNMPAKTLFTLAYHYYHSAKKSDAITDKERTRLYTTARFLFRQVKQTVTLKQYKEAVNKLNEIEKQLHIQTGLKLVSIEEADRLKNSPEITQLKNTLTRYKQEQLYFPLAHYHLGVIVLEQNYKTAQDATRKRLSFLTVAKGHFNIANMGQSNPSAIPYTDLSPITLPQSATQQLAKIEQDEHKLTIQEAIESQSPEKLYKAATQLKIKARDTKLMSNERRALYEEARDLYKMVKPLNQDNHYYLAQYNLGQLILMLDIRNLSTETNIPLLKRAAEHFSNAAKGDFNYQPVTTKPAQRFPNLPEAKLAEVQNRLDSIEWEEVLAEEEFHALMRGVR